MPPSVDFSPQFIDCPTGNLCRARPLPAVAWRAFVKGPCVRHRECSAKAGKSQSVPPLVAPRGASVQDHNNVCRIASPASLPGPICAAPLLGPALARLARRRVVNCLAVAPSSQPTGNRRLAPWLLGAGGVRTTQLCPDRPLGTNWRLRPLGASLLVDRLLLGVAPDAACMPLAPEIVPLGAAFDVRA